MLEAFGRDYAATRRGFLSQRRLAWLGLVANAVFWLIYAADQWSQSGLFYSVGVDFSRFWAATQAFAVGGPGAGYSLGSIASHLQPLSTYYGPETVGLRVGPVPYPPIFLELFRPFTLVSPPLGFVLWTVANLLLAGYVVRALASRFAEPWPSVIAGLLLFSSPLMMALVVGQMVVILLAAFYCAVRAFEDGNEFRAGLWAGLLVLKPQYAVVLFLVFLLKRRWRALGGVTTTGVGILLASLAAGGLAGSVAFARMLTTDYPNYAGGLAINPGKMISWRGLVIDLFPTLNPVYGLLLTGILSLLTAATLPIIWRGRWNPGTPRFAVQLLATMIATLLLAYHSQFHGAALLLVPGAIVAAHRAGTPLLHQTLLAGLCGMPLVALLSVAVTHELALVYTVYLLLMVLALAAIVIQFRAEARPQPAPLEYRARHRLPPRYGDD